jgi:hypothetical protein
VCSGTLAHSSWLGSTDTVSGHVFWRSLHKGVVICPFSNDWRRFLVYIVQMATL